MARLPYPEPPELNPITRRKRKEMMIPWLVAESFIFYSIEKVHFFIRF